MPVFWFLVVVAAVLLWVLLSFVFRPLGRLVSRLLGDVKEIVEEETPPDDTTENSNQKENENL